ncbi:hypothetical protein AUK10_04295 [Candidatus Gracilibacteria bacterium CG2_30_37_12]|nr:MAG: hypothetical protein AUK10_04295 [Candidatus Gracilibacteria bacterium CG2_30_37_12]
MTQFQEYVPLIKLILLPVGLVLVCFILQRWLRTIVDMLRKLEDFVIAFNKSSILILFLYFVILIYIKLT